MPPPPCFLPEAIVYSWDFRTSIPVWNAIRVQPVLADEIQTFKSLILVHKLLQEGHPIVRQPDLPSGARVCWLTISLRPTCGSTSADAQGCPSADRLARDMRSDGRR